MKQEIQKLQNDIEQLTAKQLDERMETQKLQNDAEQLTAKFKSSCIGMLTTSLNNTKKEFLRFI